MRRDMDLVRTILKELADSEAPLRASFFSDASHSPDEVAYHFEIMADAGLIEALVTKAWGGAVVSAEATSLTWAGNDFLDAVSNDDVWTRVKRCIGRTVGAASLDTIKAVAVKVGTDYIMGQL